MRRLIAALTIALLSSIGCAPSGRSGESPSSSTVKASGDQAPPAPARNGAPESGPGRDDEAVAPEAVASPPTDRLCSNPHDPGPRFGGTVPSEYVLSYLTGLGSLADGCAPGGCQWRIYDPATGWDSLFLVLPQRPRLVRWTGDFGWAEYLLDEGTYTAAWRDRVTTGPGSLGATGRVIDFWHEQTTRNRRYAEVVGGTGQSGCRARVWEYATADPSRPREPLWRWVKLTEGDAACACVDTDCLGSVDAAVHPQERVRERDLLRGMKAATPDEERLWRDGRSALAGRQAVAVKQGNQILIVASEDAACPMVIDADSREVLFSPSIGVIDAVWVKPPDSWQRLAETADRLRVPKPVAYVTNFAGQECGPGGCQWRLFDTATGRDELFLTLNAEPRDIAWDEGSHQVTFRAGDRLFEADWRAGAAAREIATLPHDLKADQLSQTWFDDNSQAWEALEVDDGGRGGNFVASFRRWELTGAEWKVAEAMKLDCYTDEPCGEILKTMRHTEGSRTFAALSRRGGMGSPTLFVNDDGLVRYPSLIVPGRFLEAQWQGGEDESYLGGPLRLVIGETGESSVVADNAGGGFSERAGFLLVSGTGPLIDLRSGKQVIRDKGGTRSMIWVEPLAR